MSGAPGKASSIALLVIAQVAGMSLWFASAAILADMQAEVSISPARAAMLSSAVQAGFVVGALGVAFAGLADRFDPRRVFLASALVAASANALLLAAPIGGVEAVLLRGLTGAALAGVYPVGMKIAIGWGEKDRGLLVGLLVGALTLGSAAPHGLALFGGADWRLVIQGTSLVAAAGGVLALAVKLGPFHARAPAFDPRAIRIAWTDRRIRLAYAGYLGHMWELYAMWAWIGVAATASAAVVLSGDAAIAFGKTTAMVAVGIGAPACVAAGLLADRIGKAQVTILAMGGSGAFAIFTALSLSSPPWLVLALAAAWGFFVIADSAQFSALVADFAPRGLAGSLLTLQTALGFGLTIFTVQLAPMAAAEFGWRATFIGLAAGPAFGVFAMMRLRASLRAS